MPPPEFGHQSSSLCLAVCHSLSYFVSLRRSWPCRRLWLDPFEADRRQRRRPRRRASQQGSREQQLTFSCYAPKLSLKGTLKRSPLLNCRHTCQGDDPDNHLKLKRKIAAKTSLKR